MWQNEFLGVESTIKTYWDLPIPKSIIGHFIWPQHNKRETLDCFPQMWSLSLIDAPRKIKQVEILTEAWLYWWGTYVHRGIYIRIVRYDNLNVKTISTQREQRGQETKKTTVRSYQIHHWYQKWLGYIIMGHMNPWCPWLPASQLCFIVMPQEKCLQTY